MSLRRELILLLVGGVVGATISGLISTVVQDDPEWVVAVALLVIALGVVLLSLRFLGPLHLILTRKSQHDLSGHWSGQFEYEKNGENVVVSELVEIRQQGRYVTGTSRSTNIQGAFPVSATSYRFQAALRVDGVLDGRWTSTQVNAYYGLLQAKINASGNKISGTWMGVEDVRINKGEFVWLKTAAR